MSFVVKNNREIRCTCLFYLICIFYVLVCFNIFFVRCEGIDNLQLSYSENGDVVFKEKSDLFEAEHYDVDYTEPDAKVEHTKNYSIPIVPKCCDLGYGYSYENKSMCVETEGEFLLDFADMPYYSEEAKLLPVEARYEYFLGDPCYEGKYLLDPDAFPDDIHSIYSNGTLLHRDHIYNKEEFCIETVNATPKVFLCFESAKPEYKVDLKIIIYAVGLLISIPFLIATALVYMCIDVFRDLRGKSLSCHVLCLGIAYFFLALVQLATDKLNEEVCIAAGFIIQFFFVAAFLWLNVISFETWRSINSDFRSIYKTISSKSGKYYFVYYFAYGFYGPAILLVVSLIMDLEPSVPESFLKPKFGLRSCWFYSDESALPYFYGPVGIIISFNIIFFVLSLRKIYIEQRRQIKIIESSTSEETREKFFSIKLYIETLKECVYLFFVMGLTWATEVISWAIGGSQVIWAVTDVFNTLQGILIFYLFVLKPQRIRKEVKRQLYKMWKKVIYCNCKEPKDEKRVTRHWHADISNEVGDINFNVENRNFIEMPSVPRTLK